MKIEKTNFYLTQQINQQALPYKKYELQQDSFVKSSYNQAPSFRGETQNIYKKILSNPTLAEKFMGLVAAGAAALLAGANIGDEKTERRPETENPFTSFLSGIFAQNKTNSEDINKYKEENKKLKEENDALKSKIESIQNEAKTSIGEAVNETSETPAERNSVFPKKRGRLSKNQQELKNIVDTLTLTPSAKSLLTLICQELLNKNSHKIQGTLTDNNEIAKMLTEELSASKDNNEQLEKVTNKYAEICEITPIKENSAATQELAQTPKLRGVKIVGKIDSDSDKNIERTTARIIRDKDGNIQSIFFKKSGTPPEYSAEQLDNIFRHFVKTIYNDFKEREKLNHELEKPMWLYNIPIPERIRKSDIEKEIKKMGNSEEKYEHITKADYQEIVDTINEDPRYKDLFDIHSALRLIDRFVNLKSVNEGIDVQSKKILDKLFNMIEQAYKDGISVNVYKDKKSGFIGPSITLRAENFDQEALDIFGPTDIILGISERQNGKTYKGIDNNKKEAIISTIYAK